MHLKQIPASPTHFAGHHATHNKTAFLSIKRWRTLTTSCFPACLHDKKLCLAYVYMSLS